MSPNTAPPVRRRIWRFLIFQAVYGSRWEYKTNASGQNVSQTKMISINTVISLLAGAIVANAACSATISSLSGMYFNYSEAFQRIFWLSKSQMWPPQSNARASPWTASRYPQAKDLRWAWPVEPLSLWVRKLQPVYLERTADICLPAGDISFGNKSWAGPLFTVRWEYMHLLRIHTLSACI